MAPQPIFSQPAPAPPSDQAAYARHPCRAPFHVLPILSICHGVAPSGSGRRASERSSSPPHSRAGQSMQNPALIAPGQQPVPMNGEMFVLSRGGISFSAKSGRCDRRVCHARVPPPRTGARSPSLERYTQARRTLLVALSPTPTAASRNKFDGKGDLYLSTLRLVFVSKVRPTGAPLARRGEFGVQRAHRPAQFCPTPTPLACVAGQFELARLRHPHRHARRREL